MPNPSPLRYPGGKNRLASFIDLVIQNLNLQNCTYVEPFAGGAGVALSLLLNGTVDNIIINDYDKAIYSFWRAIKKEPDALISRIEDTPVTIEEWHRQKDVYSSATSYSLDLAFATLFLNRTNRSGILNAGPIGGYSQAGEWKLDVRFDKEALIAKIGAIAEHRQNITIYNKDINVYCEDVRAISFLQYILSNALGINLDLYMSFVDINLGWTNYVQLAEKRVPEFRNNIIVLDGDVPTKPEYRSKARAINEAGNFIFLPLVIEKSIFELLKNHAAFSRFQTSFSRVPAFTYDVCFNSWPLAPNNYNTDDFKHWYAQAETALGDQNVLFAFWCNEHRNDIDAFVEQFISLFNLLAERNDVDALPPVNSPPENQEGGNNPEE